MRLHWSWPWITGALVLAENVLSEAVQSSDANPIQVKQFEPIGTFRSDRRQPNSQVFAPRSNSRAKHGGCSSRKRGGENRFRGNSIDVDQLQDAERCGGSLSASGPGRHKKRLAGWSRDNLLLVWIFPLGITCD